MHGILSHTMFLYVLVSFGFNHNLQDYFIEHPGEAREVIFKTTDAYCVHCVSTLRIGHTCIQSYVKARHGRRFTDDIWLEIISFLFQISLKINIKGSIEISHH